MDCEVTNGTWHPEASSKTLAISPAATHDVNVCRGTTSAINDSIMRWRNFHSPGRGRDLRDLTTELVGFDDNRCEEVEATSRTSASLVIVRENEEIRVARDWILIIFSSSTPRIQLTRSKILFSEDSFMRVLVVEDYDPIRSAVVQALTEEGYAVDSTDNGRDGLWHAKSAEHDVIVLDILLPHVNGIEILQTLRSSNNHVPVLLLTALDEVDQRIKGLDEGADDYLVKPFAIAELVARVKALLRRSFGDGNSIIEIGSLRIDTSARLVFCNDKAVELTAREYGLLELLARRRGKVVSRAEIWKSLYDFQADSSSNVVDVYIGYLRKKLDPAQGPSMIQTRRGLGYVLTGRNE